MGRPKKTQRLDRESVLAFYKGFIDVQEGCSRTGIATSLATKYNTTIATVCKIFSNLFVIQTLWETGLEMDVLRKVDEELKVLDVFLVGRAHFKK